MNKAIELIKNKSERALYKQFIEWDESYWGKPFWAEEFFMQAAGQLSENRLENSIKNQPIL